MRFKVGRTLVLVVSTAALLAVPAAEARAQSARAAIDAANSQFTSVFAKGDGAGVAALYAADAQVFPPNSDIVSGSAAIQKFWQAAMDSGIKGAKLTTLEVTPRGDIAYEVGRYELTGQGGNVLDSGKYVVVWKRERGRWKLLRDIWNTSRPAAGR